MIYFDNAATTFLCQPAKEVLCGDFANANSPHKLGLDSARALKSATAIIADIFSCANDEIIFTSG
ncbi:MAG: aminotransferase class V-fold PLP-dependent enzyme, partial [Firmicutes bacterium]|nr:aminotransferase class V-fold PLP-dependent enzyme [Bacillota bacterium]